MSEIKLLEKLTNHLEKLPGVGKKTAQRYAYYIADKMAKEDVENFAKDLIETKKSAKYCEKCGILNDKDVCDICSSNYRDNTQIMVVKDTKDALAIEKTNQYNGLYHVLNGLISPLDGIGPDDLNIKNLEKRIEDEKIKEIIVATSFTPGGETTALYLERILSQNNIRISRIGYGLPAGGDIEYVDELTLKRALDSRSSNFN